MVVGHCSFCSLCLYVHAGSLENLHCISTVERSLDRGRGVIHGCDTDGLVLWKEERTVEAWNLPVGAVDGSGQHGTLLSPKSQCLAYIEVVPVVRTVFAFFLSGSSCFCF